MTKAELSAITREILAAVREHVKGSLAKRDSRLDVLEKRLGELDQVSKGLEHRLTRHAEHLRRIETRTASLERKA